MRSEMRWSVQCFIRLKIILWYEVPTYTLYFRCVCLANIICIPTAIEIAFTWKYSFDVQNWKKAQNNMQHNEKKTHLKIFLSFKIDFETWYRNVSLLQLKELKMNWIRSMQSLVDNIVWDKFSIIFQQWSSLFSDGNEMCYFLWLLF